MIESILDRVERIEKFRKNGIVRGEKTGFLGLDKIYSVKQGTFTIVFAEPTHGKSEFIFEMAFNQADRFGKRSLVCSPETGTYEEIVAELVHKKTGRSMISSELNCLDDKQFFDALAWISEYFVIVDTDEKAYGIPELFEYAKQWEKENPGKTIDIIIGEPYNELKHDMSEFGARQDLYIESMMGELRRACRRKPMKHFFLSIHPSSSQPVFSRENKHPSYYPKPSPRNAAGGQALYRKAMTWITLWRPPTFLKDENGWPFKSNEVHCFVDKAKPKGVSFKGMVKLFFDWQRNRYQEGTVTFPMYAFDHETKSFETVVANQTEIFSDAPVYAPPTGDESEGDDLPF